MLTLKELCRVNQARQEVWPGANQITGPIGQLFVALEVAEEAGEVGGAVKKLIRHELGIAGNKGKSLSELRTKLEDEIADAFINLARLCNIMGVNPDTAIRSKFNETSRMLEIEVFIE